MSDKVELLIVEHAFDIKSIGVILLPDFSVPKIWKNRTEKAELETPDGRRCSVTAQFNLMHFNMRVTVVVLDYDGRKPPIGSKLLALQEFVWVAG